MRSRAGTALAESRWPSAPAAASRTRGESSASAAVTGPTARPSSMRPSAQTAFALVPVDGSRTVWASASTALWVSARPEPQRRDAPHRGVGRRQALEQSRPDLVATLRAEQADGKLADAGVSSRKILEEKPDVVGRHVVATMAARVSRKPSAERRHRSVTEGAAPAAAHGVGGQPAHRGGGAPRSGDQLPDIVRRGTHDGRAPWLSPQHADDGEERDGSVARHMISNP